MSTDRGIRSSRFALSCVAAVALLLSTYGAATAGLTATILNVDDSTGIAVTAGDSFNIKIGLNSTISLSALQLRLEETTDSGYFTLTSVVGFATPAAGRWSADGYDQITPTMPDALDGPSYLSGVIGGVADNEIAGTGTGSFDFVTLGITVSEEAVIGDYYLSLADIVYGDTDYSDYFDAGEGTDYHVQVVPVPAPGAFVLGLIGLGMVRWARRWIGPCGNR